MQSRTSPPVLLLVPALFTAALGGCKATIEWNVPASALTASTPRQSVATLWVEVAACGKFEDSSTPSSSLQQAQREVSRVVPGATYRDCVSKGFDSFARFDVPALVGGHRSLPSTGWAVALAADDDWIGLHVARGVRQRLRAAQRGNPFAENLQTTIRLRFRNDTGKTLRPFAVGVFVDGQPLAMGRLDIPAGASTVITLADVLAAAALAGDEAPFLRIPSDEKEE